MAGVPLERYKPSALAAAIEEAKAYAKAQDVPLTAERLAASLDMDLEMFRRISRGEYPAKTKATRAKVAMLMRAGREATASVVEHAMRRGSGTNMHLLYLKNNAGYDKDKDTAGGHKDDSFPHPPVVFIREEDISE